MMKVKGRRQLVEREAVEDGAGRKKQVNKTSTIKKKAGQMADATNDDGEDNAKKTHTHRAQAECEVIFSMPNFVCPPL